MEWMAFFKCINIYLTVCMCVYVHTNFKYKDLCMSAKACQTKGERNTMDLTATGRI